MAFDALEMVRSTNLNFPIACHRALDTCMLCSGCAKHVNIAVGKHQIWRSRPLPSDMTGERFGKASSYLLWRNQSRSIVPSIAPCCLGRSARLWIEFKRQQPNSTKCRRQAASRSLLPESGALRAV
eukprot:365472-Chlamydomonas_euryale.AAC.5